MKRRKRKFAYRICISLILLLVFLLTGCWDSNEPEKMVYAQGLGIDYKNGKYTIYMQLINLGLLAKSESGSSGGQSLNSEIGKASGNSLEDAIFNLYKTSQRYIHWGHLTYIVLSKNALKGNGLQSVVDTINRYFETHYLIWIYSTNKPLEKILNTMAPLNMSTYFSRLSDPEAAFKQYSFVQSLDIREINIQHFEPPYEIIIPYIIVNKNDWKGDDEPQNVGIIKGVSILGANNKLKGNITGNAASGFRWMEKKFVRTGLNLQTKEKTNIGLIITKRKVKITPIINNGNVQFDIQIKAKAAINRLEKGVSTTQLSQEAKKIIKNEILKTYQKGFEINSDVYCFSHVLYEEDFPVWKKFQVGGKIPLTKDSLRNIQVKLLIKDAGKQRKIPALN